MSSTSWTRAIRNMPDWLVDSDANLPEETRLKLAQSLFGGRWIFFGGVFNTIAVSALIAARIQTWPFFLWAAAELLLMGSRLFVLNAAQQSIAEGKRGPIKLNTLLGLGWAAAVGYGTFISILSGDWTAATLAALSSAAMVGGICFRNFAAPRLVGAMIALSLGPAALGAILSGQTILLIIALQVPCYLVAMTKTAMQMNKMLVGTMLAERENDRRAHHDVLTGVLNRAGLNRDIADRTAREETFSLFYMDLDGFKEVNDTFGHQVGDEVLKLVGERLRSVLRTGDSIARVGGDEFVVIAKGGNAPTAQTLGNRMARIIADDPYRIGSERPEIGISIGVALYPDHGTDLGSLIAEADTALYQAKFWGRSRCIVAGSAVETPPAPTPVAAGPVIQLVHRTAA